MSNCKHKFSVYVWKGAQTSGGLLPRDPQLLAICEKCGDHKVSKTLSELKKGGKIGSVRPTTKKRK